MHHAIILGRSISSWESVSVFILGLFLGLFVSVSNVAFANQAYQLGAVICPKFSTPNSWGTYPPWDFSNCVLFLGGLAMACLTCSISTKNAVACGRWSYFGWSMITRWFQIFLIFTHIWRRFPFWLIFFRWVETTTWFIGSNLQMPGFYSLPVWLLDIQGVSVERMYHFMA